LRRVKNPNKLAFNKMSISKRILTNENIAIKNCKHGIFTFLINDSFVSKSLDLYGEWCEPELALLSNFIFPNSVVIDAGAFIGTHTIAFAKMAGSHGFVFAFEPQRIIYNTLCGNVSLNNLLNVKCLNAGLSDVSGKAFVPLLDPSVKQNFGGFGMDKFTKGEPIPVMTIDELNLRACTLIKADVEGMEAKILIGGVKTIKRFRPTIYVENNREGTTSKALIKTLLNLKYECWWHFLEYYNPDNFFKNKENVFAEIYPEANMICIPKERKVKVKGSVKVLGVSDNWKKAMDRL